MPLWPAHADRLGIKKLTDIIDVRNPHIGIDHDKKFKNWPLAASPPPPSPQKMRTARVIPLLLALLALIGTSSAAPGNAVQTTFSKKYQRPLNGRFLHITDFHVRTPAPFSSHSRPMLTSFSLLLVFAHSLAPCYHQLDKYYRAGSTIKSSCHDRPTKNQFRRWLSGEFGTPGTDCDSPFALVEATVDWIKKKWMNKIDFIVWTGDNARWVKDGLGWSFMLCVVICGERMW